VDPTFFATPDDFRGWFEENHENAAELLVGFYKKASGKPSITWPEAVDQALCFGWIDGVRKGIDETSYAIRFSPRKPRSIWSAVNIKRAEELSKVGLMTRAGLSAFGRRTDDRSAIYAHEQRHAAELDGASERQFRANRKAWEFFASQPRGYQTTAKWWVISAKREETRRSRLARLIDDSEQGRTIGPLTRPTRSA
jgi:uncharacterized protein YdeI (YjbR/CyaY-like superfamily)